MFEVDGATGVSIARTRRPALAQLFLLPCQLLLQAFDAVEGVVEACVVERLEPSADGGERAAKISPAWGSDGSLCRASESSSLCDAGRARPQTARLDRFGYLR